MNKQCTQCSKTFRIDDQDALFYKKITVPEPTQCPDCREQRRLAWRNERMFYQRACDLCKGNMITMYRPGTDFIVYCQDCWWSDKWDATDYGETYNPNRSFLEQYLELLRKVPRLALSNNNAVNSPYVNWGDRNKNCYMATSANDNEDCYYGFWLVNNTDCGDVAYSLDNRMCYELIDCTNCNQVRFSQDSRDCNESWFLYDCVGVSNSFGCTNLRMKQYHIFNVPHSPEDYERKVADMIKDRASLEAARHEFEKLKKKAIKKYTKGVNNVNVTGGGISNSSNAKYCFDIVRVVDSAYMFDGLDTKDSYDIAFFAECELVYESHSVIGYDMKFANVCRNSPGAQYSDSCHNSSDIFGCAGLRKQQFSILNKTYSEEEYAKLKQQIINDMTKRGEYGEFLPAEHSFFGYNETLAMDFYPLHRKDVEARNWQWHEPSEATSRMEMSHVPDSLTDVGDDIVTQTFGCEDCTKPFRMIVQEVDLYKRLQVQLPKKCFVCRQQAREQLRNPWRLFTRQCMCTQTDHGHNGRCVEEFETNYAPDNTAIIYCEGCYQKEIY